MLELGAHEAITITGTSKEQEMDLEHGHVEHDRDHNQAKGSSDEVFHKETRGKSQVTQEQPKLMYCAQPNSGNSEESNPFAADDSTER